jgi:hypothetical protein
MLKIVLACAFVLDGQAAQAQAGSAAQTTTDPSQMSLAERAAAARKAKTASAARSEDSHSDGPSLLTPEQRGAIQGSSYVNNILELRIALGQWQPLTADRAARSEETARLLVNPDERPSPFRVLWIGDNAGRNIAVAVVPIPANETRDLRQMNEAMKKIAVAQLARATDISQSDEPFLLSDATHTFAGFRTISTIQGKHLVQAMQMARIKGFLVSFTITGDSDSAVTEALRSLKTTMTWARPGQ